jgi:hypothetical protein
MGSFDYFVMFAEMRTGSNFLESNLNAMDGCICHGEAFNPHFIGYPNSDNILGITKADREAKPETLINRIKNEPGALGGFRYFNDHDPRVFDIAVPDPRCAKIVLTRNPAESYVSWKIAQATGQWKLTNVKNAKSGVIRFDAAEFEAHLAALQSFQIRLMNALQTTGQTAFYVDYEDLQDVGVMNGLAAFLGVRGRLDELDKKLKKQNPAPLSSKVENFDEMDAVLARLDRFNLSRTPNFEPRRGPMIPNYCAAGQSSLLYMPIKGGPEKAVRDWLTAIDGGADLRDGFTQKTLRQWKRQNSGHRAFTVVRHPVQRAHWAFCEHILGMGEVRFGEIRQTLKQVFKVDTPQDPNNSSYDDRAHRAAFLKFLEFLKANLSGQTSVRVDASWASQSNVVQGFAQFGTPDIVIREERLAANLAYLAYSIGRTDAPDFDAETDPYQDRLMAIYDKDIEKAARDAYQRDFLAFGFSSWR